jgi:hypothetical protein
VFLAMTGLLIGTFGFFGLHTLAWLVRAVWLYLHDSKTFREAKIKTQEGDEWFTRFQPFERFLHFLVVTSFLLLVITGHAAEILLHRLGEIYFLPHRRPGTARMLHRFGAIITFLYFTLHLSRSSGKSWKGRGKSLRNPGRKIELQTAVSVLFGPDSMVPTMQDLTGI